MDCPQCKFHCPPFLKCRAHHCMMCCRKTNVECCSKSLTVPLTDNNGRFLDKSRRHCEFPWSDYLYNNWLCPQTCKNSCGKKHLPPNENKIPTYFKKKKPFTKYSTLLPCNECGKIKDGAEVEEVSREDILICQEFQLFRSRRIPIIWIYGHPQGEEATQTRASFCNELAAFLGFTYVNFDKEIEFWVNYFFHETPVEDLLSCSAAMKRLANLSVKLMEDDELHLNLSGTLELVRLVLISITKKAMEEPQGFILDNFPCSRREARAFEDLLYPMVLGIYLKCKARSRLIPPKKPDKIPREVMPTHFRREEPYSEETVEATVDSFGERSLKILNMEMLGEDETNNVLCVIRKTLKVCEDGSVPRIVKCENPACDCFGRPPDDKSITYNCNPFPYKESKISLSDLGLDFLKSLFENTGGEGVQLTSTVGMDQINSLMKLGNFDLSKIQLQTENTDQSEIKEPINEEESTQLSTVKVEDEKKEE